MRPRKVYLMRTFSRTTQKPAALFLACTIILGMVFTFPQVSSANSIEPGFSEGSNALERIRIWNAKPITLRVGEAFGLAGNAGLILVGFWSNGGSTPVFVDELEWQSSNSGIVDIELLTEPGTLGEVGTEPFLLGLAPGTAWVTGIYPPNPSIRTDPILVNVVPSETPVKRSPVMAKLLNRSPVLELGPTKVEEDYVPRGGRWWDKEGNSGFQIAVVGRNFRPGMPAILRPLPGSEEFWARDKRRETELVADERGTVVTVFDIPTVSNYAPFPLKPGTYGLELVQGDLRAAATFEVRPRIPVTLAMIPPRPLPGQTVKLRISGLWPDGAPIYEYGPNMEIVKEIPSGVEIYGVNMAKYTPSWANEGRFPSSGGIGEITFGFLHNLIQMPVGPDGTVEVDWEVGNGPEDVDTLVVWQPGRREIMFPIAYAFPTRQSSQPVVISFTVGTTVATVNGDSKNLEARPVIVNGRTMVPLRFIADATGAILDWDPAERKATYSKDGRKVILWIGKPNVEVNGTTQYFDPAPFVEKGTTLVPVRLVAEALGFTVLWDEASQTVTIASGR